MGVNLQQFCGILWVGDVGLERSGDLSEGINEQSRGYDTWPVLEPSELQGCNRWVCYTYKILRYILDSL